MDEEFEDIAEELERQIKAGEESAAQTTCVGVVLGLFRARDISSEGALGWAPDWLLDQAENVLTAYLKSLEEPTRTARGIALMQTFQESTPGWAEHLQRIVNRVMKP